jgi:hypothetical protein
LNDPAPDVCDAPLPGSVRVELDGKADRLQAPKSPEGTQSDIGGFQADRWRISAMTSLGKRRLFELRTVDFEHFADSDVAAARKRPEHRFRYGYL